MSRSEKYLLIGAAAFAGYWFYSKSLALARLVFSPGSILGVNFTGGVPSITVAVNVQNTSNSALELRSFAGNVSSNGTLIGNVYNFLPVEIPGNSQVQMPVQIQLQILGITNDLIQSFTNGNFTQQIEIAGSANVNGFQLPVSMIYKVGN